MFCNWFKKTQYTKDFQDYLTEHKVECNCPRKKEELYKAYIKNKKWIQENENKVCYKIGSTSLSTMDPEKYKHMNKTIYDDNKEEYTGAPVIPKKTASSIDWSTAGYVSPVIQQGECGSCWAFTATGAVESAYAIKKKIKVVNLSEQQMVDCMPKEYDNHHCQGGVVRSTLKYMQDHGVCLDDDYQYVSGLNCKQDTCMAGTCKDVPMEKIKMDIQCYSGEDNLMQQLQKGPVTAIINTKHIGLQHYKEGVFDFLEKETQEQYKLPDHGVLVVGYGEEDGIKFWKIKNTWGDKWGENGYFRIKRGSGDGIGLLGIARQNCGVTIH